MKLKAINSKRYDNAYIISVDNLAFGGTGKTPLVIKIGKDLNKKRINFCIITRGYKSKFEKKGIKVTNRHSISDIGDEAALFRHYFPKNDIYIGKNRFKSIENAIKDNNKIIILDDGFQTSGLFKDFKIMLLNPNHKYYYLRNFKFFKNNEDIVFYLNEENNKSDTSYTYHFDVEGLYNQKGLRIINPETENGIIGFSALGDNKRFKQTLIDLNLNIIDFQEYNDHYPYTKEIINKLNNKRKNGNYSFLICSEKDFIKIKELNLINIPLIYIKNSIKLSLNLTEKIIQDAEKKHIKTQN